MAINRVRQLDSVELLPGDRVRVKVSTFYADSATGAEEASREPAYLTLDPNKPGHQPAINACRSAWNALFKATQSDR